jgi:hypothetical protein
VTSTTLGKRPKAMRPSEYYMAWQFINSTRLLTVFSCTRPALNLARDDQAEQRTRVMVCGLRSLRLLNPSSESFENRGAAMHTRSKVREHFRSVADRNDNRVTEQRGLGIRALIAEAYGGRCPHLL